MELVGKRNITEQISIHAKIGHISLLASLLLAALEAAKHGGLREYLARTIFASCTSCFMLATSYDSAG